MLVAVTGACGHLGATLVRRLLDDGHQVRAIDTTETVAVAGLALEFVRADVVDAGDLESAFAGAELVFHCAAARAVSDDRDGLVDEVNVAGARNAGAAALASGVGRFVHASSVHAFDLRACGPELDETAKRSLAGDAPGYDRSRAEGELAVAAAIERGLDAVVVNPTTIIGPYDFAPSPLGQLFLDLRARHLPIAIEASVDFVDVRDVAAALIAAATAGRSGENYLVSGHRLSLKELAQIAEEVTGSGGAWLTVPKWLVAGVAPIVDLINADPGPLLYSQEALQVLQQTPLVSHRKATAELGYFPRSVRETVRDLYAWFDESGPI